MWSLCVHILFEERERSKQIPVCSSEEQALASDAEGSDLCWWWATFVYCDLPVHAVLHSAGFKSVNVLHSGSAPCEFGFQGFSTNLSAWVKRELVFHGTVFIFWDAGSPLPLYWAIHQASHVYLIAMLYFNKAVLVCKPLPYNVYAILVVKHVHP